MQASGVQPLELHLRVSETQAQITSLDDVGPVTDFQLTLPHRVDMRIKKDERRMI